MESGSHSAASAASEGSGAPSNDEHLAALRAALDPLEAEVHRLADGLTEEQLDWRPAPERWSIAQCFEHLVVSGARYHALIAQAIDRAWTRSLTGGTAPYRPGVIGGWLVATFGDVTARRRFHAPRIFSPAARPAPGAPDRLIATQRELRELLHRAAGLDLTRVKTHSPATRLVRMNLGDALALQVVHMARHLAQARRVREDPAFPTATTR